MDEFRDPRYRSGIWGQYQETIWGTVLPTWHDQSDMLSQAGFATIECFSVKGMSQGMQYLVVARKF